MPNLFRWSSPPWNKRLVEAICSDILGRVEDAIDYTVMWEGAIAQSVYIIGAMDAAKTAILFLPVYFEFILEHIWCTPKSISECCLSIWSTPLGVPAPCPTHFSKTRNFPCCPILRFYQHWRGDSPFTRELWMCLLDRDRIPYVWSRYLRIFYAVSYGFSLRLQISFCSLATWT